MPRCVIFDCDGVLVDSEPIACRVDAACLTQAGLPISTEEVMARFVGMSSEAVVKILSAEHGVPVPKDLDLYGLRVSDSSVAWIPVASWRG